MKLSEQSHKKTHSKVATVHLQCEKTDIGMYLLQFQYNNTKQQGNVK